LLIVIYSFFLLYAGDSLNIIEPNIIEPNIIEPNIIEKGEIVIPSFSLPENLDDLSYTKTNSYFSLLYNIENLNFTKTSYQNINGEHIWNYDLPSNLVNVKTSEVINENP
jgi:hypothetical protein